MEAENTVVRLPGGVTSAARVVTIAGPCPWRRAQIIDAAAAGEGGGRRDPARRRLEAAHSPYAFQGLGRPGSSCSQAREETGLLICTKPWIRSVGYVAEVADIIQIAPAT